MIVLRVTDDVRRRPWPFANPLLPTRRVLPNLPQLFLSIVFSFLLLFQKIKKSHSRKLTESLNTFANPLLPIPDICYGSHGYTRVIFFWPVQIFTDLTQKIGIFDRFYAKSGVFFYRFNAKNWRFSV